ncbi:AAA family ATPase [Ensifer adhaerens]|uniref:AAA family ATPase n=1 Tax=Ensifer adhaerens TaxID=106592 RepID=UPI00098FEF0D|nr:AAA family ATPase [Ensifer adhaerens]
MNKSSFSERAATLEVVAYSIAARTALRKGGVLARKDAAVGLVLSNAVNHEVYADAVKSILKSANLNDVYTVVRVEESWKGQHNWTDAIEFLGVKPAVIILIPEDATIPPRLVVGLDRIVNVGELLPTHLAAAIKSARGIRISSAVARSLLAHPPELIFQSLRPGRSIEDALSRLSALAARRKSVVVDCGVEDLPGFGAAQDWVLDLSRDIADWRKRSIPWEDVDCGLLLSGPTGTGKTMFASAAARTCGINFMAASSAEWQAAGHLGDYLKAMRKSFREAADKAPTILFLDEFDAVGDRSKFRGDNAGYGVQVVNGILEMLDGSSRREGVVVIAATNHPDSIDPALKRPGRLDRHVAIQLPEYDDRKKILSLHLGTELPADALAAAARATAGYSGALLAQLARDARKIARRNRREVLPQDILEVSPPLVSIDIETRTATAIHEAGHAIVGVELAYATVSAVVVLSEMPSRCDSLGHVEWQRSRPMHRSEQSYRDEIAMLMAGMAAEREVIGQTYNGVGGGVGSDLQRATDIATVMVGCLGMGSLLYNDASTPEELAELRKSDSLIRRRVERVLAAELERSIAIIRRRRSDLETLTGAVLEKQVVSGDFVMKLLQRDAG